MTAGPNNKATETPVTCDNAYVSVVSGGKKKNSTTVFTPAVYYIQTHAALAFVPFDNSYDFRITFAFMTCCYQRFPALNRPIFPKWFIPRILYFINWEFPILIT